MKHVRFFVGATIAAMTFLACNKEDTKPVDGPRSLLKLISLTFLPRVPQEQRSLTAHL